MILYITHVISPLAGLMIDVITQLLICRNIKSIGLLKSIFIGFFCGCITVFIIEILYFLTYEPGIMDFSGSLILNSITYGAFGYGYFHFINLGETARRIRILRELSESENGLTRDELLERYNASAIINIRIRRMINNNQIVLRDGRYYLGKPIMLYMAKAIVIMKLFLLGRKSEI
ncbi:hypothetical protein ACFL1R_01885 [Candidatus Latescibacterota bacterium]